MTRRCSVMRMPLATHCASITLSFGSVTPGYRRCCALGPPGVRPQMEIEQAAGKDSAALLGRDGDRKNLRLVRRQPGKYEALEIAPGAGPMRQHVAIQQQPLELVLGPAAPERGRMQLCEIGRASCRERV